MGRDGEISLGGRGGFGRDWGMSQTNAMPLVGVIMGSKSDWETMRHASEVLDELNIPHETNVVSAHRTPRLLSLIHISLTSSI